MKPTSVSLIIGLGFTAACNCPAQPIITSPPTDLAVTVDDPAQFHVAATTNAPPLRYQWRRGEQELPGETGDTLELPSAQFVDADTFSVVVTDATGSVTSPPARLSVTPSDVVRIGDRELRVGEPTEAPVWEGLLPDDEEPWVSGDGLTLLFHSGSRPGAGGADLWMTTRRSASAAWDPPVNIGSSVNSADDDNDPRLSGDGLTLYFDSNRSGGRGGYDSWSATRTSLTAPFGPAVNTGPPINGNSNDVLAFLSPDGRSVVFASDRPGGLGDVDIWTAFRASVEAPWEPARNPGAPVNSSRFEFPLALSADGLTLFIKSWRSHSSSATYVLGRTNTATPFGQPVLIRPIEELFRAEGVDSFSLSADDAVLYFNIYPDGYPGRASLRQLSLTPLPQLRSPRVNPSGEFAFDLLGREGASYLIETSTDAHSWTPWITTNTISSVVLTRPGASEEGHRFFRGSNP